MRKFLMLLGLLLVQNVEAGGPSLKLTLSDNDDRVRFHGCSPDNFKGLLQPESERRTKYLKLRIETDGLARGTSFHVMYTNNGYKKLGLDKYVSYTTTSRYLSIPVYAIDDSLPFAVNQVVVTAQVDGLSVSDTFSFQVMRTVVLEKSFDDSKDCLTMHKAEKLTGLVTNTSSQPRTVEVEDKLYRSRNMNVGSSRGWFMGGSVFSLLTGGMNMGWFQNQGRGFDASSSIRINTKVAPGETLILTRQMTMVQDSYDVYHVDECGEMHPAGNAFYRHWLVTYPVASVDMNLDNPFTQLDVGYNDQLNTCVGMEPTVTGDDIFVPEGDKAFAYEVNVDDAREFNRMGATLSNEGESLKKRRGAFGRWMSRMFKRR